MFHLYDIFSFVANTQIYLINLERRPDRREKMEYCFRELGIKAKLVPAVDGKWVYWNSGTNSLCHGLVPLAATGTKNPPGGVVYWGHRQRGTWGMAVMSP